jgi:uncharacterized membrane protein
MKIIHIVAGLVALLAGFVALFASKGSPLHRRSGRVFAAAMLLMASSGALMALVVTPHAVNVVAGSMTCYLVASGWLTVKRRLDQMRALTRRMMFAAAVLTAAAAGLGVYALQTGPIGGVPAGPIFLFAFVGLLATHGDLRLLRAGGIEGNARIARHLWRMTFALWIATSSFFLGQAKLFPEPVRTIALLAIPPLLVLAMLAYWLLRTWRRGRQARRERAGAAFGKPA